MPMRTTLPRNLTRHFYETRRAFLQSAGQESTPWFRLSPLERSVVESEMEIFRQAIRRAEEEQDMLASLDATTSAATDEPAPAEKPTDTAAAAEDCPCPGCSAVAALLALLKQMGTRRVQGNARNFFPISVAAEATVTGPGPRSGPVSISDEDLARAQESIKADLERWAAEGKPVDVIDDPVVVVVDLTAPRLTLADLDRAMNEANRFDALRREFWTKPKPTADQA
ncbi:MULTISPECIES: hypothetical protein [Streptomyces]|uniref:hypothetical protein n=1 Tax=Streptomyces TaxID=1883 RepID=UPI00240DE721|nr:MULTISPECIES: hypothetical protein [Streptomyces]WFB83765.1 hypothetical protein MMU79_10820 [Streptomyces olivaceus]WGK50617.1 hypothetical protein M6G09_36185 [Streptomyces sp. B146]